MKRALHFLADYWLVPVLIVAAIVTWLLVGRKSRPAMEAIQRELDVVAAGRDAREHAAKLGAKEAADQVWKDHLAAGKRLDEQQAAKAQRLRNDPVGLSKFLVRAAKPR